MESVGLAGDGFAVGWVAFDGARQIDEGLAATPANMVPGSALGREWINANIPERVRNPHPTDPIYRLSAQSVRQTFWDKWQSFGGRAIELWGDTIWPVEARFLIQTIDDSRTNESYIVDGGYWTGAVVRREMDGPYPLLDICTLFRICVARNTLFGKDAPPIEPHNPLEDARASARKLFRCLRELGIDP